VFVNQCLKRILNFKWSGKVSNEELWQRTKQTPIEQKEQERKWRWLGQTLPKPEGATQRHAWTGSVKVQEGVVDQE
jgi:hypothetical protein